MRLQLRLETFNTWNHLQFAGVNGGIGTPGAGVPPTGNTIIPDPNNPGKFKLSAGTVGNAGKLNSARDPRQIQLGAKFYF
jgi:hypothetical protein